MKVLVMNLILTGLVVATAMAVIYAKHQSRELFGDLQALEAERDRMNTEWGQLQLEQSALTTHGQVERAARKRLQMQIPEPDQVRMVLP